MTWAAGDRVRTNSEHAWLWRGTEWEDKMSRQRCGTVERVSLACKSLGAGTVLVRWDSLTDAPNRDDSKWRMWVHSDLITRDANG